MPSDWMQTYTGVRFYPLDPKPEMIRLEDVAHQLSMLCRYAGAVDRFYSVAEHSYLVSKVAEKRARAMGYPELWVRRLAQWGLFHDASEAYLSDIARPAKHSDELAGYRRLELAITTCVVSKFDLYPVFEPVFVKEIDTDIIGVEARKLKRPDPKWTLPEPMPELDGVILGLPSDWAKRAFLDRYAELYP